MKLQTLLLAASLFNLSTSASVIDKPSIRKPQSHRGRLRPETKYFHEPGESEILGHYDVRYFLGQPVSYEVRGDSLHHMVRAYLTTFRHLNIETWIAHGTLLGWWWNGRILPWDWDLDVQTSLATLVWLGENMNMTTHKYTFRGSDGTEETREYLLDVNPNLKTRVRGRGLNVIDARWIDIRNGLFIDITGLSETNPRVQPGIWSCKNYHRYRTRDLYPLRETIFEGVPALVPYSFDKILTQEYSARALTNTLYEGHEWNVERKTWIPIDPQKVARRRRQVTTPSEAIPHIPRSLKPEPRAGLGNLLRLL